MRPSMRAVASRAGVSVATVSYVLNQGPRPVSAIVRERVLTAVRELGYVPSPRVRTRGLTIGVMVPDVTTAFFAQALHGIDMVLRDSGHVMLAGSSRDDSKDEAELLGRLLKH